MDKKISKKIKLVGAGLGCAYLGLKALAYLTQEKTSIDDDNPYLSAIADNDRAKRKETIYERFVKPELDSVLSFCGMITLLPVYAVTAAAVYLDDPGPVFFSQKRVGKDKHYFMLHKFRTMRMDAPHDTPTHLLSNPEQHITRVGRIIRQYSIDELPQLWDAYRHKLSMVGPRPALWNQADLIAERDKYGANDIKPGITGLAQISGRDELSIEKKARLDGEYAEMLSFGEDLCYLLKTVKAVVSMDGVVEGNTRVARREIKASNSAQVLLRQDVPEEDPKPDWGFKKHFEIDRSLHKQILITGAGSYIGESFKRYAQENYGDNIEIDTLDLKDKAWREQDFSGYDCVYHVAGIAHVDVNAVNDTEKEAYYRVNTDLAIETAKKAKAAHVKQFIFMSSIIVYGTAEYIDENTVPSPANFYGDSKWQADRGVRALADERFHVAVLRPPMVYGKGSRGNYLILSKLAKMTPVFPETENQRSVLYIDNLCEFLCKLILSGEGGIYMPQNVEYASTGELVSKIALAAGKRVFVTKLLKPVVTIGKHIPGKISRLTDKAFGNNAYDRRISTYEGMEYALVSQRQSIQLTEVARARSHIREKLADLSGKQVLLVALPGYRDGILEELRALGAEADLIHDKPNDRLLCKTMGRLHVGFYERIIDKYYQEQLEPLRDKKYDYILSIRGEYTPVKTLRRLKRYYPDSRLILYMWDGLGRQNTKGIENKWPLYDCVYTFDRLDYEQHKNELRFLPLFYYEKYLSPQESSTEDEYLFDLSFIGTGHADRARIVKTVMTQCKMWGMKCYSYIYVPHPLIYGINKICNKDFAEIGTKDVKFEMLPLKKLYETYGQSRCLIDVENPGQHGLTMRTIEAIGLKKKLITTNKDIVNYDFYHPDNIMVIDRKKPEIDCNFFKKPYVPLDEEIYKKYSLRNWILEVLQ